MSTHDPLRISAPNKVVLGVLMFTAFVMMLNETTLAVALPAIMKDYQIEAATAQWLLTGFMLTMAIVLPTTGWLLERFTTRSVFVFAVIVFLVGTIIAALAPTFEILLLARVAQGMGTAVIMPLLMFVTMTVVPPMRRGTIMGIIAVVMAVGPAIGPTFAGFVLSLTSWHGIFWVMVPLVALAGVVGLMKISNVGHTRSTPLDVLSVILSVFAFGGVVYGLSSVGVILDGGRDAVVALILLGVGAVGLVLFVWRQIALGKHGRALLNLAPLKILNFTLTLLVLIIMFGALLGMVNTLPSYLQNALLVSAFVSGVVLLPGGLLEAVISPIAGRIYDLHGPRLLIITGMVLVVGTLFWLSTIDENTQLWLIVLIYIIFSLGLALLFGPLMTTALSSLPNDLYSHGSAILNTLQQLAGALGTAAMLTVFGTVSSGLMADGVPETTATAEGASAAFLISACVAAVGLVVAVFIKQPQPREEQLKQS